jgi:hypothetical protein
MSHNQTSGQLPEATFELSWIILHNGVRYEERGPQYAKRRAKGQTLTACAGGGKKRNAWQAATLVADDE